MANEQPVTTSERLWSEEVALTDQSPEDKTAYQFSNGRRFQNPDQPYTVDE